MSKTANVQKIKKHFVNKDLQNLDIFLYDVTDSTNTRAKLFAEEHPEIERAVFIAEEQSAGRGRMNRNFDSDQGGLYISLLLRNGSDAVNAPDTTMHASVVCASAIETLTHAKPKIKWVNDIILNDKKLAGILTEGRVIPGTQKVDYLVCGIGINLYSRKFPDAIKDIATSLEDSADIRVDKNALAACIIERFFKDYKREEMIEEYRRLSCVVGKEITVHNLTGESFPAKAICIEDNGALTVEEPNGNRRELISAEVSVRLAEKNKTPKDE